MAIMVALTAASSPAFAQARVQFPSPYPAAPPLVPVNPNVGGLGGIANGAGAYLGGNIQPFDPYAFGGNLSGVGPPVAGPVLPQFGAPVNGSFGLPPGGLAPGFGGQGFGGGGFGAGQGSTGGFGLTAPPPGAPVLPTLPGAGAPYGQPLGGSGSGNPWLRGPNPNAGGGGAFGGGASNQGAFGGSQFGSGGSRAGAGGFGGSGYGAGGLGANANGTGGYGGASGQYGPPYQRLFQDTGLRGTWIFGEDEDDLSMTEAEASTTAYFANFLGVPNGLRVTPGFAFHWTDGPNFPSIPARLYSGYIDFGLNPQFGPRFSMDLTARAGIYTDFQSFNGDSIRLLGSVVGVYQASPEVAIKLGAVYIDRVQFQLLPAAGILWTPNPQTRWDIFFPAPKLSNYWTTFGNRQVWWYLGGEYGGGSWSIQREVDPLKGADERIDINDIRVYAGLEWWSLNRAYGFAEIGFLFDREVVFYRRPDETTSLDNTFMVRGGISW